MKERKIVALSVSQEIRRTIYLLVDEQQDPAQVFSDLPDKQALLETFGVVMDSEMRTRFSHMIEGEANEPDVSVLDPEDLPQHKRQDVLRVGHIIADTIQVHDGLCATHVDTDHLKVSQVKADVIKSKNIKASDLSSVTASVTSVNATSVNANTIGSLHPVDVGHGYGKNGWEDRTPYNKRVPRRKRNADTDE